MVATTYAEINLFTVEKQPSALKANRAELKLATDETWLEKEGRKRVFSRLANNDSSSDRRRSKRAVLDGSVTG